MSQNNSLKERYPSATLLQEACLEDYKRVIETYNKIYDKINIALAFSGVILLVILGKFDYTLFFEIGPQYTKAELFAVFVQIVCSTVSSVSIVWAVIQLLLLTRSRQMPVFDSIAIRNGEIYNTSPENAALWLIDKYTSAIAGLIQITKSKQEKFDAAIVKILVSLLSYALLVVVQKGV